MGFNWYNIPKILVRITVCVLVYYILPENAKTFVHIIALAPLLMAACFAKEWGKDERIRRVINKEKKDQ